MSIQHEKKPGVGFNEQTLSIMDDSVESINNRGQLGIKDMIRNASMKVSAPTKVPKPPDELSNAKTVKSGPKFMNSKGRRPMNK